MGANGLGSTASGLSGGSQGPPSIGSSRSGGGGGGRSEFHLVLQEVVNPGTVVSKGELVAEFDRENMLNRLDDYRASVAQTESSVTRLRAELEISKKAHDQTIATAKADLEKARQDIRAIPVLSDIEAETTRLALEEAEAQYKQLLAEVKHVVEGNRAQLKASEIDLEQSRLELKRAEANADKMLLRAPIGGLTVMQTTFRGSEFAQIQAGDQLWPGMVFMQIVDVSSMIVNATVNQVDVEQLRIGAKARVRFDAYPDLELPARVYSIGAITNPGGRRENYVKEISVRLKLEKTDPRVIPDLTVSVDVIVESEEQATMAPLGAVFRDGPSAVPYAFVRKGSDWERREVELGLANNVAVSIRSGLRPGEVVAAEPPPHLAQRKPD
ncbi:MAG: efflux RND transporter periplasmic adaptor subunit [Bryobacteraceae bacterium]